MLRRNIINNGSTAGQSSKALVWLACAYYNSRFMEIIPTGGALGAEIRGVDVTKPLAPAEVAALEEAILQLGDAPFLEL